MIVLYLIGGAVLGAMLGDHVEATFGLGMGLLLYLGTRGQAKVEALTEKHNRLEERTDQLERELARLEQSQNGQREEPKREEPKEAVTPPRPTPQSTPPTMASATALESTLAKTASVHVAATSVERVSPPPPADAVRPSPSRAPDFDSIPPSPFDTAADYVRNFFTGGNTIVRVGLLVLLVGVTLLLKYAADNAMFPLELRMAAAALLAIAMVVFGLRQRQTRPGFSQSLQGGGIAAMYLVVFFSYRIYGLLPPGLALGLLVAIACAGAILAIIQDAMPLIVIAQIGGFLAPILASTGGGSHVALFSYYLVLNGVIFGVAWNRAWRLLNLIGFAFTFGIGTTWGNLEYSPDKLASTEPFLIAFFLMYVAIPVLYAVRHQIRGWVDGSLIFGAPLAFLGLQLALVRDIPFAMAYTTLGLAVLYVGLARWLKRRALSEFNAMQEAFIALGVGFATLAVPYGLDNSGLTSATWSLEGAGLYWLGIRQHRGISRLAAVGLQLLGGGALLRHAFESTGSNLPIVNTRMLAALFVALGALFIARHAYKHRAALKPSEWKPLQGLIGWALLFFIPSGLFELSEVISHEFMLGAALAFMGATGLALELAGQKLDWRPGRIPAIGLHLALLPIVLTWHTAGSSHFLQEGGWFGWPVYFAATALTLHRLVPKCSESILAYLHPISLWGLTGWSALLANQLVSAIPELGSDWALTALGLPVVGALWGTLSGLKHQRWPFRTHAPLYRGLGIGVLCSALLLFYISLNIKATGTSAPLPYLPLVNPVDLIQLLGLAGLLAWVRSTFDSSTRGWPADLIPPLPQVLAAFAFLGFNAMLARTVHQYTDVPFRGQMLWRSVPLQVAMSVSWTLIGLLMTALASRKALRNLWIAGACLLGIVVVKLFFVDLERLSAVAKIGTFLAVGVLLMAVGYFAPVPPSGPETTPKTDPEVTP